MKTPALEIAGESEEHELQETAYRVPSEDVEQRLREELADAHRLMAMENLNEGTWTHLSVIHPTISGAIFVTPGFSHFSTIRPEDLTVMSDTGDLVSGPRANPSAWVLHAPLHVARPDALCVIHAHPPYSTALFANEGRKLETRLSQAASSFEEDIAYFDVYDGALTEYAEGERMAQALGSANTLILRNHGVMICGESVGESFLRLYALERAAMIQTLSNGSAKTWNFIPPEVMAIMNHVENRSLEAVDANFNGWRRALTPLPKN